MHPQRVASTPLVHRNQSFLWRLSCVFKKLKSDRILEFIVITSTDPGRSSCTSLTCAAPNAMNAQVSATPKLIPKRLARMKRNQLRAMVQHPVPCFSHDSRNASMRIPLYRDDDGSHCHASPVDVPRNRIPFYISQTPRPSWTRCSDLPLFRRRSFGCADAVVWPIDRCPSYLCCCTNCCRYSCDWNDHLLTQSVEWELSKWVQWRPISLFAHANCTLRLAPEKSGEPKTN